MGSTVGGEHGGWIKQTNYMAKQKEKNRHIANSDTDSENSYPASQPTNSSLSTSTKKPYVPRLLIIHSEKEDESISSLSPFLVHKTIMNLTGEPKSIKIYGLVTFWYSVRRKNMRQLFLIWRTSADRNAKWPHILPWTYPRVLFAVLPWTGRPVSIFWSSWENRVSQMFVESVSSVMKQRNRQTHLYSRSIHQFYHQ